MAEKLKINEQIDAMQDEIAKLTEKYPDLHIAVIMKVDKSVRKPGESTHGMGGNYCAVCAWEDLGKYIFLNKVVHNSEVN